MGAFMKGIPRNRNLKPLTKLRLMPAALMLCVLPWVAQAGVPIEKMQRALQARFHCLASGNYILGPPCRSGLSAPLYPPDGFYGSLDDDPTFAAYLVQDICWQFNGGWYPLWFIGEEPFDDLWGDSIVGAGAWVGTDSFDGQASPPTWLGAGDFPSSGSGFDLLNVTTANYAKCAAVLDGYLSKLIYFGGLGGL